MGLTEIGLPCAADPAITRHLARFLTQQAGSLHTGAATILPSANTGATNAMSETCGRKAGTWTPCPMARPR